MMADVADVHLGGRDLNKWLQDGLYKMEIGHNKIERA
jgi:hypothetical protein